MAAVKINDSLIAVANDLSLNVYNPGDYTDKVEVFKGDIEDHRALNVIGNFRPRPYQARSMNFMLRKDLKTGRYMEGLRAVLCEHRRAGKTIRTMNTLKIRMLNQVGHYFLVYPTLNQGRKVIWDAIAYNENRDPFRVLEIIPPQLWKRKDNHLMSLELFNGSVLQVVGAVGTDGSPDHLRGTNPIFAGFDEFAAMSPLAWRTVISPIFMENGGSAMFTFTPDGKNHAYDLYHDYKKKYESDPVGRFYASLLTINDTARHDGKPVVSEESLQELRDQGVSEEYIQREFYCSFEVAREGSFYADLLEQCRAQGRIGKVAYDPTLPVFTGMDLGIGTNDFTTIWFYQIPNPNTINFINYLEFENQSVFTAVDTSERLPYPIRLYGMPWDGRKRDDMTGLTKQQRLRESGKTNAGVEYVERVSVAHGIELVRNNFSKFHFDETHCALGLDRLRKYEKAVSTTTGHYTSSPVHNENSHGADALRTVCNMIEQGVLSEYTDVLGFQTEQLQAEAEDEW